MNGLTRQLVFLAVLSAAPILSWNLVFTPQNERINQINEDIFKSLVGSMYLKHLFLQLMNWKNCI